jgi:hypothetical protein
MSIVKKLPALLATAIFASCTTLAAKGDVAALVVNPSAATRAELMSLISKALDGAPVTLADDAFTRDSTVIIERARITNAQGLRLQGRELQPPAHFKLVKSGRRCVLVQEETGKRSSLRTTRCKAAQ